MKIIFKIFLYIILIFLTIYNGILALQKILSPQEVPDFWGYKSFIISSGSMENTLSVGDIIFVKERYDVKPKDIISYKEEGKVVTHRVIEILSENGNPYFKTQGDANNTPDDKLVSIENLEGIYEFKIPKIGTTIMFLQTKKGMLTLLLICLFTFGLINLPKPEFNKNRRNAEIDTNKTELELNNEKIERVDDSLKSVEIDSTDNINNNENIPKSTGRRKRAERKTYKEKRKTCNVDFYK